MLTALGITDVVWDEDHRTIVAARDGMPGYILSRSVEKNRRPVVFVYAGDTREADGRSVHLNVARVKQSMNLRLADAGLVYPTYYRKLFSDLRDAFTTAVIAARAASRGAWQADGTTAGTVAMLASLEDTTPILPKLFRRPGAPQLDWDVAIERANVTDCTYWITVKNLTGAPVTFEGRYAVMS